MQVAAPLLSVLDESALLPRLLVVDDQPANIQLVYQIFASGYQVFIATSGEQALEFCAARPPDLLLLDVIMPGIGGLETCRRLKQSEATRDLPVIFVTSGTQSAEEEACWEAGGVDFVTKPVVATTLRNRVRVHLKLKRQSDLLRQLAYLDGLTGVANRRYFNERYDAEWRRCRRGSHLIALIMIDVDFFKRYNDHYGHQAGDDCLRAVAAALKNQINRPSDLFARYGGEEFVCLLPETTLDGAMALSALLERTVRELGIEHARSDVGQVVTISLGVACTTASTEIDPQSLLGLADEQLYQSKQQGRGRASGIALDTHDINSTS